MDIDTHVQVANSSHDFDLDFSTEFGNGLDLFGAEAGNPAQVNAASDYSTILTAFCFCGCTGSISSINPF